MSAPLVGTVVLFLGGDPALAETQAARPAMYAGFSRFFLPGTLSSGLGGPKRRDQAGAGPPMAFPPEQVMCAQRLLDLAKRLGRTVRLVDVNHPGNDRPLVERFVGPSDVLPIALRFDGERLEGEESFEAGNLRQFLQGA